MTDYRCAYCRRELTAKKPGDWHRPDAATRDHILPRERGGTLAAGNVRICCQRCNELRAELGHCIGALACFLAVLPEPSMTSVRRAGRAWAARDALFRGLPQ